MAAFDLLLTALGQDKFLQLYQKYNDTMTALKGGASGAVLTGNGVGSAPTMQIPTIRFAVVESGPLNLNAGGGNQFYNIPHGLDGSKIRSIDIIVRSDSGSLFPFLTYNQEDNGGLAEPSVGNSLQAGNIRIIRPNGSVFQSLDFSSTSNNRFFITIGYVA
jgi:hypothetical protein